MGGWLAALGATIGFMTSLMRLSPWLIAFAQVIAAIGGIRAIYQAIRLRQRHAIVHTPGINEGAG